LRVVERKTDVVSPSSGNKFSLSQRERAGVREKA
jgi:hypothetical protein